MPDKDSIVYFLTFQIVLHIQAWTQTVVTHIERPESTKMGQRFGNCVLHGIKKLQLPYHNMYGTVTLAPF